ncbi:CPXCG motif-containing cysteine-rich protein [Sulfurospirillum sp.]|nr:CPXCG motif-containing cysteine-rich protein [Sulfurospirillum sp.]
MEEIEAICPYCWQTINLYLDTDTGNEKINIIEDCRVCCRPIEISYTSDYGKIRDYSYHQMDGNN